MRHRDMPDCIYFTYIWSIRDKYNIDRIGISKVWGQVIMSVLSREENREKFNLAHYDLMYYLTKNTDRLNK